MLLDNKKHVSEKLIEAAQKNPESFGKLYDQIFPNIFQFVVWRLGNKENAEDLVSEIFIKILKNIQTFQWRGEPFFWAWVFRIARNAIINFSKKKQEKNFNIDDLPEVKAPIFSEHDRIQDKIEVHKLRKIIESLPKRQSEILIMHFFSELRNKEIAEVCGIEEKSVAGTLTRATRRVYEIYVEESGNYEERKNR
jgi:RNA polymerase sigma-70 factor, ECF subfamily